ncbi:ATP-binding protein [Roseovarius ramblicola]|uniref:histidine kinase n=1 Tax=Roseovarius ramblicola TaxID=2022336 RepID=A0ABV5I2W3_9RHOB
MAELTTSGETWQRAGQQLAPRAGLIGAAAMLFVSTGLLVGGGQAQWLLTLVGAVLFCAALWLRVSRFRAARARSARLAAAATLSEHDPRPLLLSGPKGKIAFANRAARDEYAAEQGGTLVTLLREQLADPGPLLLRMESRAAATGAAREDVVTRAGHICLCVHRAGESLFMWRIEKSADPPLRDPAAHPLPMMTVGRGGTVLYMNPAVRDLIGSRVRALGEVCGNRRPRPGTFCTVDTPGGPLDCLYVERSGMAGRREVYLLPGVEAGPRTLDGWAFFDHLPVPLLKLDTDGRVRLSNAPARALLYCGESGGARLGELLEGLGRPVTDWIADAAAGRGTVRPEFLRVRRAEGERFVQVALNRASDGDETVLIAVMTDATEFKSLQAQFAQSQKMQAIGQLAGGIAHDFNNLLTAITGHCDLILLRHDPDDQDYADLTQINQNANRAAALVSQLLAYSRKQTMHPRILDLRDTLSDLTHLLNRLVGERITLSLSHEPGLEAIRADKRQLEQVIMNLVVNARDAMPDGGEIRIVTRNLALDEPLQRDRAVVARGQYVSVEVTDEGTGIAQDELDKVFEPFFTTKRVGKGTGLGLSTVYGIVKQSGGFVFADSAEGKGTTFRLLFPAHAHPEAARPEGGTVAPCAVRGDGVILLVEDEVPVRAFASRALQLRGYTVIEAGSAEEALDILGDATLAVDVFVSDVVMPGLDGPGWVQQALAARPDVPVVFVSGYAEETFGDVQASLPASVFLPKPFSLDELVETVHRLARDRQRSDGHPADVESIARTQDTGGGDGAGTS